MTVKELKELLATMPENKELIIWNGRKELEVTNVRNNYATNEIIVDVKQ